MRAIAPLILLPLLATPAFAQDASVMLTDPIVEFDNLTYLDLAKVLVPGLKEDDGNYVGTLPGPVRSLAYPDELVSELAIDTNQGEAMSFLTTDGWRLALMIPGETPEGEGSVVVAIFDPYDPTHVIDMVDVHTDQWTGFEASPRRRLGPNDDGFLVQNYHFNSNQGYHDTALIALVEGKLTQMASVFTFNENYCGMRREQTWTMAQVTTDDPGQWSPFTITVTETTQPNDCEGGEKVKPGTRAVAATFSWAAETGRYEPDSSALADLFAETEARF